MIVPVGCLASFLLVRFWEVVVRQVALSCLTLQFVKYFVF